jgi:hypothetical protein
MLEFEYHGKHRQGEPYSVRQAGTGNVLHYAWELADGHIKAYKLDEMFAVKAIGGNVLTAVPGGHLRARSHAHTFDTAAPQNRNAEGEPFRFRPARTEVRPSVFVLR